MKLKPEKYSGLNGIQTHDLCDIGAVLYQLSYQAFWETATLWFRNIAVEGEVYKLIPVKFGIFEPSTGILGTHKVAILPAPDCPLCPAKNRISQKPSNKYFIDETCWFNLAGY